MKTVLREVQAFGYAVKRWSLLVGAYQRYEQETALSRYPEHDEPWMAYQDYRVEIWTPGTDEEAVYQAFRAGFTTPGSPDAEEVVYLYAQALASILKRNKPYRQELLRGCPRKENGYFALIFLAMCRWKDELRQVISERAYLDAFARGFGYGPDGAPSS